MRWDSVFKLSIGCGVILAIVGVPLVIVLMILGDMSESGRLGVGGAVFTLVLVLTLILALSLFQRSSTGSVMAALRQDDMDEMARFRASRMHVTHNYPQRYGMPPDPYGYPPLLQGGMTRSGMASPWAGGWVDEGAPMPGADSLPPGSPL